jgi:hypothetical protein
MAIILGLLLASLCVIKTVRHLRRGLCVLLIVCASKQRVEDERFKKIDAKRGGRGFV